MINANIEYHPSKDNYLLGDMESSIEFKGNRNFVANELKVFLDYMAKKEPEMTFNVIKKLLIENDDLQDLIMNELGEV